MSLSLSILQTPLDSTSQYSAIVTTGPNPNPVLDSREDPPSVSSQNQMLPLIVGGVIAVLILVLLVVVIYMLLIRR